MTYENIYLKYIKYKQKYKKLKQLNIRQFTGGYYYPSSIKYEEPLKLNDLFILVAITIYKLKESKTIPEFINNKIILIDENTPDNNKNYTITISLDDSDIQLPYVIKIESIDSNVLPHPINTKFRTLTWDDIQHHIISAYTNFMEHKITTLDDHKRIIFY